MSIKIQKCVCTCACACTHTHKCTCVLYILFIAFSLTLQPDKNDQYGWIRFCNDVEIAPTLDIIVCFTQALAEQVLVYLTEWLESETRLDYQIGRWIYALLVILEEPLFPDTCYTLRRLARVCSYIRAITDHNTKVISIIL